MNRKSDYEYGEQILLGSMMNEIPAWDTRYKTGETPWDSGRPSKELQRIVSEWDIAPCRMLEIGCGTGTNAISLAQRGFTVTAIDLSPLAVEQAKAKASKAGVTVDFRVADILHPPELGKPFAFVFDRGVYHHLREVDLKGFLAVLAGHCVRGGWYLTLAGNANDPNAGKGPPTVKASDLCRELEPAFDLVQLREFHFDGIVIEGKSFEHLGWSALLRRKQGS